MNMHLTPRKRPTMSIPCRRILQLIWLLLLLVSANSETQRRADRHLKKSSNRKLRSEDFNIFARQKENGGIEGKGKISSGKLSSGKGSGNGKGSGDGKGKGSSSKNYGGKGKGKTSSSKSHRAKGKGKGAQRTSTPATHETEFPTRSPVIHSSSKKSKGKKFSQKGSEELTGHPTPKLPDTPTLAPTISPTRVSTTRPTQAPVIGSILSPTSTPSLNTAESPTSLPASTPTAQPNAGRTSEPTESNDIPTTVPMAPALEPTTIPTNGDLLTTSPSVSTGAPTSSATEPPTGPSTDDTEIPTISAFPTGTTFPTQTAFPTMLIQDSTSGPSSSSTSETSDPTVTTAPSSSTTPDPAVTSAPSSATTPDPAVTTAPTSAATSDPDATTAPSSSTTPDPAVTTAPSSTSTSDPAVTSAPSSATTPDPAVTTAPSPPTSENPTESSEPAPFPSPAPTTNGSLSTSGVELTPFAILYNTIITEQPTKEEFAEVERLTLAYIDAFMDQAYGYVEGVEYANIVGSATGQAFRPNRMGFQGKIFFEDTSETIPPREDLNAILAVAFEAPQVDMFISMLKDELSPTNPLSTTTSVVYSSTRLETTGSQSDQKLGVVVMFMGVCLLSLVLAAYVTAKRRNNHIGKKVLVPTQDERTVLLDEISHGSSSRDARSHIVSPYLEEDQVVEIEFSGEGEALDPLFSEPFSLSWLDSYSMSTTESRRNVPNR